MNESESWWIRQYLNFKHDSTVIKDSKNSETIYMKWNTNTESLTFRFLTAEETFPWFELNILHLRPVHGSTTY